LTQTNKIPSLLSRKGAKSARRKYQPHPMIGEAKFIHESKRRVRSSRKAHKEDLNAAMVMNFKAFIQNPPLRPLRLGVRKDEFGSGA
jgi:hypothetical protein